MNAVFADIAVVDLCQHVLVLPDHDRALTAPGQKEIAGVILQKKLFCAQVQIGICSF